MKNILFVSIISVCLFLLWSEQNKEQDKKNPLPNTAVLQNTVQQPTIEVATSQSEPLENEQNAPFQQINQLIDNKQYYEAVEYYNSLFDRLDNDDITKIENLFLQHARTLIANESGYLAEKLLLDFINYHNESPQFLFLLAEIYLEQNNLNETLKVLIRARNSEAELNQQQLIELRIAQVASLYSKKLATTLQHERIIELYDELYNNYPSNNTFVLELAMAYLEYGQPEMALPYLQQLLSDQQYSEVAQNAIEQIYADHQQQEHPPVENTTGQQDIEFDTAIAMQPYGDQFLIETRLNGRSTTLLLDTGASITSLTPDALKKAKAEPMGKFIRLNTANGEAQSQLYRISSFKINNIEIKDIVVAEVNMGSSSTMQGLLGTDFLRHFHYSINNQNNTLYLNNR